MKDQVKTENNAPLAVILQRWVMRFRLWKCKNLGHKFLYKEGTIMQGRENKKPLITHYEELVCKRCDKTFIEKNA